MQNLGGNVYEWSHPIVISVSEISNAHIILTCSHFEVACLVLNLLPPLYLLRNPSRSSNNAIENNYPKSPSQRHFLQLPGGDRDQRHLFQYTTLLSSRPP